MKTHPKSHVVVCLATGFSFLEGPRWRRDRLFVSDFYTRQVITVDESGACERVCTVPGQPSGLGFATDGALLVVSMQDRRLLRLESGSLSEVADLSGVAPFMCNDMLVDAKGRAYVGNFGWDSERDPTLHSTCLALVQPDGTVAIAAQDLIFPNGIVQTPDGRTLLVAETFAARVSAFDVAPDGTLSNRRIWTSFAQHPFQSIPDAVASGAPLPDGMALDAEGALWIGDAGGRAALRIKEGGRILDRIEAGEMTVFAVALGGKDRRTLFMCTSPPLLSTDHRADHRSMLMSTRVQIPGAELP